MKKAKIQAIIRNYQRKWPIDSQTVCRYIHRIWNELPGPQETEICIVFLNDEQIRHYNKQYRKKDSPTDVLSFPVNETVEGSHYLGDILISLETTARQSSEKRHTFQRELKILLLHGILHLLGFDHETDQGQMDRMESRLRRRLAR